MEKIILIDADQFMFMNVDNVNQIEKKIINKIKEICILGKTNLFSIVLSSKINKRKIEFSDYKLNRKDNILPKFYKEIKNHLINNYNTMEVDGEEADDIIAYFKRDGGDKYIIASQDKDLIYNFAGSHINIHFKSMKVIDVSSREAERFFNIQMLIGDNVDNIPRLEINNNFKKRYGLNSNRVMTEKTASELLDNTDMNYKDFVLHCYLLNDKVIEDYFNQIKLIMMGYNKINIDLKYDKIDLENVLDISNNILGDFILKFGKYKGKMFSDICYNTGYVNYILDKSYDEELIKSIDNFYERNNLIL